MKEALFSSSPARARRFHRSTAFGIGATALAMLCACGQINGDEADPTQTPPGGTNTDVLGPDDTQPDVTTDPQTGEVDPASPSVPDPTKDVKYDPDADPFSTEMGKQVQEILRLNCGNCHIGPGSRGDFGYLLDIDQLITNEKVVPGSKSDSQLYNRMVAGTMPPAAERVRQAPTYSDIDLVGRFIDELQRPDPRSCTSEAFMDVDTQIELMAEDMADQEERDQPFTRYLTINYSANAGECGRALERQRYALFKGINSVSTNPAVTQPQPIDDAETIYRIDIRDYDWDRPIDLQDNDVSDPANIDFSDGWEAIIANPTTAAYAVEYEGEDADDLKLEANTLVPFMPVNAFVQATEFGALYYTLIGGRENLFEFEREVLKIDTKALAAEDDLMRAGFANSGVSKQERVLNRFDSGIAAGLSYWISFDFDGGNGGDGANGFERDVPNESIFAEPLDFVFAGGEAIFSLPNGMQAYYVANGQGTRLDTAPIGVVIDPAQNKGLVTNGASCHSCHNAGMISFTDTVRQFVLDNKVRFDRETFESVMDQYPDFATFQRQMDQDSAVHIAASEEAGVPAGVPDPISRVYLDFQLGDVGLAAAAAEFGVEPEVLRENLDLLDARLGPLAATAGHVDRNVMDATFLDSVCRLQSVQRNRPAGCN